MAKSSQKKLIDLQKSLEIQKSLEADSFEDVNSSVDPRRSDPISAKRVTDSDIAKQLLGGKGSISLRNEALKGAVEANSDIASLSDFL